MTIYIVLAVLSTFVALFVKEKNKVQCNVEGRHYFSRGELWNYVLVSTVFLMLFLVSALRIAIGHDYWEYTSIFSLIEQNRYVSTEVGFNLLVRICQFFFTGEKNYIAVFAIVAFVTLFYFMKGIYQNTENFGMAFFLFMAFGYYLSTFNSIRYYLVLAVAFYATKYLLRKEYGRFVFCILIASTMHMAVLFVLLAYPLALIRWKPWVFPIVSAFVASLLVFPGFYRKLIFMFYPFYENSAYDTGETSTIQIARCIGILIFALIFYKKALKGNRQNMFYFNLSLEALVVYACCSFIPVVSRIGFFLNIYQILLIPAIIKTIEKKWLRIVITVLVYLAGCGYFALFLKSCMEDGTRIVPYLNWILN